MFGNGSGNGLWMAGGVIVVLIAAGVYMSTRDDGVLSEREAASVVVPSAPAVVSGTPLPAQPPIDAPQTAQAEQAPAAVPEPVVDRDSDEATGTTTAPSFDEVRVDTLGSMVIAGRAEPGASVDVLVDGEVVATTEVDASGAFAALGALGESGDARLLTLRTGTGDKAISSKEEIILAPVAAAPALDVVETAETNAETPLPENETSQDSSDTAEAQQTTIAAAQPDLNAPEEVSQELVGQVEEDSAVSNATGVPEPVAQETSEVAVLRSDEAGVTLVPSQPALAQTVMLDTIGYSDDGTVQLGGRAESSSVEVRAYLNNRAVARLPVDGQGNWRGEIPQVDAGVYTLRVDALSADGAVASRIETPFKREEPSVLAAAVRDSDGPVRAVTVQAGDTLWAIARDRYGEGLLYVQVFEANRTSIRNPDLIYPGQVFELPVD